MPMGKVATYYLMRFINLNPKLGDKTMISSLSATNSYSYQATQRQPYASSFSTQETNATVEQKDIVTISQDAKNLSDGVGIKLRGYSAPDMLTAQEKAAFSEMKKQGNLGDDEMGKMAGALAMDRYMARATDPSLDTNYNLDLEGHFHLTGAAVPSLDTNYIMKLMRESHISNTTASEISQKSLSMALAYLSRHPVG